MNAHDFLPDHAYSGTCALCGADVIGARFIEAAYLTCNMVRPDTHTRAELQAFWWDRKYPGPAPQAGAHWGAWTHDPSCGCDSRWQRLEV